MNDEKRKLERWYLNGNGKEGSSRIQCNAHAAWLSRVFLFFWGFLVSFVFSFFVFWGKVRALKAIMLHLPLLVCLGVFLYFSVGVGVGWEVVITYQDLG
jgi:hypothetical protein